LKRSSSARAFFSASSKSIVPSAFLAPSFAGRFDAIAEVADIPNREAGLTTRDVVRVADDEHPDDAVDLRDAEVTVRGLEEATVIGTDEAVGGDVTMGNGGGLLEAD
jgi:hypothetical protein